MKLNIQNLKNRITKRLYENKEKIKGGKADNKTLEDIFNKHKLKHKNLKFEDLQNEFNRGIKVEMEHTNDKEIAKEIALDHLIEEDPFYYTNLAKIHKD